jgi:hypothetical protein
VSKKQTQCARILELLASKPEVSALELSSISLQYAARVCELRKTGASIANRVQVKTDGTRHGFYRLMQRAPFLQKPSTRSCRSTEPIRDAGLFSANELELGSRWFDEG